MSKCPYTWFRSVFKNSTKSDSSEASELRVRVSKAGEVVVDVSLPARSAHTLIDIIPDDVITIIRQEGIPIDSIHDDLAKAPHLIPQAIFTLTETSRHVEVWLE